ncbi:MAG: leucine-rich repeat domain-containing protein, partial [Clostridia bacterium]|nr:leucine-rich repeat domain-containing protein [Clostridia bacterium]
MKKIIAILSTVVIVAFSALSLIIPVSAEIQTGDCGLDGAAVTWAFNTEGNSLTISGEGAMANYSRVDAPWKSKGRRTTSITIEDGVTVIGASAFSDFTSVGKITIAGSVQTIKSYVFSDCVALTELNLNEGLVEIGKNAFSCAYKLTTLTIPNTVTTIGESAFNGSEKLTTLIVGNGLTTIGANAFANCPKLTTIYYTGTTEQWDAIKSHFPANATVTFGLPSEGGDDEIGGGENNPGDDSQTTTTTT